MNRLSGITRRGATPLKNPGKHSPLLLQNRIQAEVVGPDGVVKHRIDHRGNILATYGLNRLIEMLASDAGARSLQYNATFASNGNACSVNEVGLFATNNATQNMIARSVLGTDSINRGTADEIRISYQIIAGTA